MPVSKCDLKINWATHDAARYACEHWHYSGCLPAGKLVKVGAWENGKFIGAVLFGRGANNRMAQAYGLRQDQAAELVRVALCKHAAPVSRIVALSIKFLKKSNPRLRLVVSFADQSQGHHGGIYQAGNWIYTGSGQPATFYKIKGKMTHPRTIGSAGYVQNLSGARQIDPRATAVLMPGKHRYLMPFDTEMRSKILPLARPYPKRAGSDTKDTPANLAGEGGSTPTPALHSQAA
jgi:hypothetical protein